jgi:hypothetical protein
MHTHPNAAIYCHAYEMILNVHLDLCTCQMFVEEAVREVVSF